jgi:hypothetical protein
MQSTQEPDGKLVVTHDSMPFSRFLALIGLVLLGTAAYDVTFGRRGEDRLVGLLCGAATCLLAALLVLEKTRFVVDPNARRVSWRRRWGLRVREGTIAFDDVRSVGVQVPLGDEGVPSRRICFQLRNAPEVPVTVGYAPDLGDEMSKLSLRIDRLIAETPAAAEAAPSRA